MTPVWAAFITGFFIGGMFGVFVMGIVAAHREFDFDDEMKGQNKTHEAWIGGEGGKG